MQTKSIPAASSSQAADASEVVPCLYCDSVSFQPLFEGVRDRTGFVAGEWSYLLCRDCGSANLRPFPREEDIPGFYPPVYSFSPEIASGFFRRAVATAEYQALYRPLYKSQVNLVRQQLHTYGIDRGRMLDIGCGRGLRLLEFQRAGFDVTGMDFVPDSVNYLTTVHGIPAKCTDFKGLSTAFEANSFDVVTAFAVVEHVLDVVAAIKACLELVRPGGIFLTQMPYIDGFQARFFGQKWQPVVEAPRHITLPSVKGVRRAFERAGLAANQLSMIPDTALANGALIPLSMLPGSSTTHTFGSPGWWNSLSRLAAGAAIPPSFLWGFVENKLLASPAQWLTFAQKCRSED
jgi:SAM-dependent methyltransferase